MNAIVEKPVVVNGEIVVRPMSALCLVADHRILDGAEAARFLARIKELVENPWLLLFVKRTEGSVHGNTETGSQ